MQAIREVTLVANRCLWSASLGVALVLSVGLKSQADEPPAASDSHVESAPTVTDEIAGDTDKKSAAAPKIDPGRFREVDRAATLMIWLVASCGLGGAFLLTLIVVGARRIRRLTRSRVLQSKYDELEYLRLKHRREIAGLGGSDATKVEP